MRHRFPQDRSANTRRKETSVTTRGNVERPRRSRKMMRAKALGERIGFNLSAVEQSSISDIYEARLDTIQAGSGTTFHRRSLSLSRWAWCIISVFFICRQLALPPPRRIAVLFLPVYSRRSTSIREQRQWNSFLTWTFRAPFSRCAFRYGVVSGYY